MNAPSASRGADGALLVRCPACGGPSRYASDNAWRPFCTEACRQIDLGAWASESYRVSASPPDLLGGGDEPA
jgi:endogenous inhibitor of DNA gyrase (YacG/DUF329 family)